MIKAGLYLETGKEKHGKQLTDYDKTILKNIALIRAADKLLIITKSNKLLDIKK
ncbi:MAG: hypothetical protein FWH43_04615 [Endomicrobia bacterium]|nr:hypothetical protein [Endomicrobiia bacterium]